MRTHTIRSVEVNATEQLILVKGWWAQAEASAELALAIDSWSFPISGYHPRPDVADKYPKHRVVGFSAVLPSEFIAATGSDLRLVELHRKSNPSLLRSLQVTKRVEHVSEEALLSLSAQLSDVYLSWSWRITAPFRGAFDALVGAPSQVLSGKKRQRPSVLSMVERVLDVSGDRAVAAKRHSDSNENYRIIKAKELSERAILEERRNSWIHQPTVSVVVPVYNVEARWLDKCIESVLNQWYERFELCLFDDASTLPETKSCLQRWAAADPRIKVGFGRVNQHISLTTNEAIALSSGEFVALLDNDDELCPDALMRMVEALNFHPGADFFFSDEDKLEMDGRLTGPYLKPGFNAPLFLSNNYLCHFSMIRRTAGDRVGWLRKGFEGSQDFDLFLRLYETAKTPVHVPYSLYHWRRIPGSTASEYSVKHYANTASLNAIAEHLSRTGAKAKVENGLWPGSFRVRHQLPQNPLVSIIIPFRDKAAMLHTCVESILERTQYKHYELLLVNNQSAEKETQILLDSLRANAKVRVLDYEDEFNFSAINNWAAGQAAGEFLCFLNNDTEVIAHEWLLAMLEWAHLPNVGAVGAKLIYRDLKVQHAGVVLGVGGVATHAFHGFDEEDNFYFGELNCIRACSAVTAACMLVEKKKFDTVGGFNEQLAVAYNDVDLCMKLRSAGFENIYTPYAKLFHDESRTRGADTRGEKAERLKRESEYFLSIWGSAATRDPYYHPRLNSSAPNFVIAAP